MKGEEVEVMYLTDQGVTSVDPDDMVIQWLRLGDLDYLKLGYNSNIRD